ncbi:MAG: dihydroorotase [Candidatus Omnitrophica bacterium]|nr:dihydroorotase [Candidatus Omnitrophota bacterium]
MSLLIKNAKIINAQKAEDNLKDILIEKGQIARVGASIKAGSAKIIDAEGKWVMPGFVDLHVHLREPGREDKETIESGSRAAAKGGFTSIVCMPNTKPVIDNAMVVEGVIKEARRVGLVNVYPAGAITRGQKSQEMVDMYELKKAGCIALTDDGRAVDNSQIIKMAMQYAKMVDILLMEHCQDYLLTGGGVMNEGYNSTFLGLKPDPGVSETVIVARDIELAAYLGARIHLMHISLERSVELIRKAKEDGIKVTAEATPHHFTLTDDAVKSFDPNTKVNPPLRSEKDVEAVKRGIKEGIIDCIVTDHAPHNFEDKEVGFAEAPFGIIGLETALGLVITELVDKEVISAPQMVDRMAASPANIARLANKGLIEEGKDADVVIIDPEIEWEVKAEEFVSKSRNSPFIGKKLKGCVEVTICGGRISYQRK